MTKIYDQFDAATSKIEATAILLNGEAVGRVVIKWGNAATAYVQVWGAEMVRGQAGGGGYDRATAAVSGALRKLDIRNVAELRPAVQAVARRMLDAFAAGDAGGQRWSDILEKAGFVLARVI